MTRGLRRVRRASLKAIKRRSRVVEKHHSNKIAKTLKRSNNVNGTDADALIEGTKKFASDGIGILEAHKDAIDYVMGLTKKIFPFGKLD